MAKYYRNYSHGIYQIHAIGENPTSEYFIEDPPWRSVRRPVAGITIRPGNYVPSWDFTEDNPVEQHTLDWENEKTTSQRGNAYRKLHKEERLRREHFRSQGMSHEYIDQYHYDNPLPEPDPDSDPDDVEAWDRRLHDEIPAPDTLFHMTSPTVTYLATDPSLRHTVPTLLGAALQFGREAGRPVVASSSLSRHSAPIVQRGIDAGVVKMPDGAEGPRVTNGLRLQPMELTFIHPVDKPEMEAESVQHTLNATPVPEHEVENWKNLTRSVLRPNYRPRRPISHVVNDAPQFEQLRLDM